MRLYETNITPFINNSIHLEYREQSFLFSPHHGQPSFHSHPELELTFIQEGYGKRIIGNQICDYKSGDMVFIGSGLPHVWLSAPPFYEQNCNMISKTIVAYINLQVFEPMLNNVKECESVKDMIDASIRGISIHGNTRNLIASKLEFLLYKSGFEKLEGFLQIMNIISSSNEISFILKDIPATQQFTSDRMNDIYQYMNNHLSEQITLEQVAEVACLTIPSFCRYFKKRTQMTFFQYLTQLRIQNACKLLIEMDQSVSWIGNMCGFNSDSHFCKVFKEKIGQSPFQYKSSIQS